VRVSMTVKYVSSSGTSKISARRLQVAAYSNLATVAATSKMQNQEFRLALGQHKCHRKRLKKKLV
jgi:hypothetical protein